MLAIITLMLAMITPTIITKAQVSCVSEQVQTNSGFWNIFDEVAVFGSWWREGLRLPNSPFRPIQDIYLKGKLFPRTGIFPIHLGFVPSCPN